LDDISGALETCASTQAEREIEILPTDTNRWVGIPAGAGVDGLDWLTVNIPVALAGPAMAAHAVGTPKGGRRWVVDSAGTDTTTESAMAEAVIGLLGGYPFLGPSRKHGTVWYGTGIFGDDGSWSVQRDGKGSCQGGVIVTMKGKLLERLSDRGLSVAREVVKLGGHPRRVDVMAEGPIPTSGLHELYELLEAERVHLPSGLTWSYQRNKVGHTLYLGSQSSEEYVCIYDRRGVLRAEVRGRGKAGEALLASLLGTEGARTVVGNHLARYGCIWSCEAGAAVYGAVTGRRS